MFHKPYAAVLLLALSCLSSPTHAAPTQATTERDYFILDNDFAGPGGTNIQSVIPLLGQQNPSQLLGFTVVVGDGWENESVQHLSRFLDAASIPTTIPVVPGATQPLVNSRPRLLAWEKANGIIPWKGAWRKNAPDTQPMVPTVKEGTSNRKPSDETAALFLIRQVHAHPHQVTIIAAGPLTNIALAVKLDPDFAALCKRLIFMGAIIDGNLQQITESADYYTDFNLIFDPEAAAATLEAPFPEVISVGSVANPIRMTEDIRNRATKNNGSVSDYLRQYFHPQPMWDELTAAIALDPSLIRSSVTGYMDIDLSHGPNYGNARMWPEKTRPHIGERQVRVVTGVDEERFVDMFVNAANRLTQHD